jgi:hypothetical protein
MEQGYYIAVANCVALLGFASKDNVLYSPPPLNTSFIKAHGPR